ncbi:MAG: isocitrate lyase/phosphoenolpyruvate mutase family protein, partial [Bacteroidota bacterium]
SLLRIVERIQTATQLPLSVDVENGYGSTPDAITANIEALVHLGVAGVNIEDSRVENGRRILLDPEDFARTLATVIATIHRNHPAFFFNVRTDTFLLDHPDACTETLRRAERYAAAGANGLFVPGVTTSEDILTITKATDLPLNVMCWLGLPPHKELAQMGVARISSGNFAYEQVLLRQDSLFADLFAARDFSAIL